MQENNFDKKVQEQMDELRFRPSPAVWQKVSEELDKRKKRRMLIVFFVTILFLAGGVGIYQVISPSPVTEQPLVTTPAQEKNSAGPEATTTKNNTSPLNSGTTTELTKDKNEIAERNKKATVTVGQKDIIGTTHHLSSHRQENKKQTVKENNATRVKKPVDSLAEKGKRLAQNLKGEKNKQEKNIAKLHDNEAFKKEYDQLPDKLNEQKTITETVRVIPNDSITVASTVQKDTISDQGLMATISTEPVIDSSTLAMGSSRAKKAAISKKIRWATEISAGFSQNEDTRFELPSMNKSVVADYYAAPNYNMGNVSWQGPVGARYTPPSAITGGMGFSAGVIGELELSPKSSMLAGLQYIYQSNHVRVGNFSDIAVRVENMYASASVVSGVYRGVQLTDYTNRYHFIQLPVTYQLQLNKGKKTPITWDAGVAASYLFATNALTYDSTMGGVYFKDPNVLKRFHVNATTGFLLHLKKGDEKKWSFGPHLLLHLRQLDKAKVDRRQYLLYGGIRVRYFFK